jgi:flagellar biosynthetic protein FliR
VAADSGDVSAWALVLAAARVGPVVLIGPAAAGLPLPRVAQGAVVLVIAALVAAALGDRGAGVAALPLVERLIVLGREVLVGTALGLVAAVPLLAASTAGGWLGALGADDDGRSPWSFGLGLLAAVVYFGIGGHLAAASAVGLSYRALPVGLGEHAALGGTIVDAGGALLAAALALAAPVVVTVLILGVAGAAVERASGLAAPVVPEAAARRLAVVLAMAAAVLAIAIAVAGQTRAVPDALRQALARIGGG